MKLKTINMDSITYKKLEYITSGSGLTPNELNELVDLMDEYAREHVTEALRKHSVVRGGANESVIVHGYNTITNDQSQTTTLTAPTEPLKSEGKEKGVCGRFYTDEEIEQIKAECWHAGINSH